MLAAALAEPWASENLRRVEARLVAVGGRPLKGLRVLHFMTPGEQMGVEAKVRGGAEAKVKGAVGGTKVRDGGGG